MRMSNAKKLCLSAICTALCVVLPLAFHAFGKEAGRAFSPMHLPVLLCGLLCGPLCGLACGVLGPVLSSLISGMPPAAALIAMVPELLVYGLFAGLFLKWIRTGHAAADLYCALVPAMLLGRVAGGAAKAVFTLISAPGTLSFGKLASAYFVVTLPGAALQLAVIPALVLLLMRTKLIPARYPKTKV